MEEIMYLYVNRLEKYVMLINVEWLSGMNIL
jgi:hypothetical protein